MNYIAEYLNYHLFFPFYVLPASFTCSKSAMLYVSLLTIYYHFYKYPSLRYVIDI